MSLILRLTLATTAAVLLTGCLKENLPQTSLKDSERPPATREAAVAPPVEAEEAASESEDPTDAKKIWCGQRFIDHEEGRRPGGATTLEQKKADDRTCAALKKD